VGGAPVALTGSPLQNNLNKCEPPP
jgi:hypothetical protein